jgi:hypothetical protein
MSFRCKNEKGKKMFFQKRPLRSRPSRSSPPTRPPMTRPHLPPPEIIKFFCCCGRLEKTFNNGTGTVPWDSRVTFIISEESLSMINGKDILVTRLGEFTPIDLFSSLYNFPKIASNLLGHFISSKNYIELVSMLRWPLTCFCENI